MDQKSTEVDMIWLILGAIEALIILWLVTELRRAPLGYEDRTGFHEITTRKSQHEFHGRLHQSRGRTHRRAA